MVEERERLQAKIATKRRIKRSVTLDLRSDESRQAQVGSHSLAVPCECRAQDVSCDTLKDASSHSLDRGNHLSLVRETHENTHHGNDSHPDGETCKQIVGHAEKSAVTASSFEVVN